MSRPLRASLKHLTSASVEYVFKMGIELNVPAVVDLMIRAWYVAVFISDQFSLALSRFDHVLEALNFVSKTSLLKKSPSLRTPLIKSDTIVLRQQAVLGYADFLLPLSLMIEASMCDRGNGFVVVLANFFFLGPGEGKSSLLFFPRASLSRAPGLRPLVFDERLN